MRNGYFVSGPSMSFVVYVKRHIEPFIKTACELTDDDPDDYTATKIKYNVDIEKQYNVEIKE